MLKVAVKPMLQSSAQTYQEHKQPSTSPQATVEQGSSKVRATFRQGSSNVHEINRKFTTEL
jgi:hypothetical protein